MVKNIKLSSGMKLMTYEEVEQQFSRYLTNSAMKWHEMLKKTYEDLLQDLRVETYRCYLKYDINRNICFSTYLIATISGTLKKFGRDNKKEINKCSLDFLEFKLGDERFEDNTELKLMFREMSKEINKLDDYGKKIIYLRYVEDLSFYKIAAIFNRDYNAIWMKHKRSLKQIEKMLRENGYEGFN